MSGAIRVRWAQWDAPPGVYACTTMRSGGVSGPPCTSLNLAMHVDDDPRAVAENRRRLREFLGLPGEPVWIRQVHGTRVVDAARVDGQVDADGSVAARPGVVCAVLTADCVPLFLCTRDGTRVGLLHVGWRGLAAGMVEQGIARLGAPGAQLLAWLGPAIGPDAYEIGADVVRRLGGPDCPADAFVPGAGSRWLANLHGLLAWRLERAGVTAISRANDCTLSCPDDWFSHRRDGPCGRMASLLWMAS